MLIRHKLNSLSGLFLGALLLLLAGVWWSSRHLDRLHSAQALTLTLDNRLLEIHLSQTNFLMLLDERQTIQLRREADLFKQDLKTLQDNLDTETHLARIERLQQDLSDYLGLFETLVEESRVIGLDHESGLYGSLRQAVHRAEKAVTALQRDDLLAGILQLRRDEKDFMLRSDLKYLDKFNTDFDALLQRLGDNNEVRAALTRYQEDFTALVNARTRVGLQPDTGLKARLHAKMHDIDDQFEQLQGQLTEQLSLAQQRTRWQLLAFGLAVASLVVFLTILIARGLNRDLSHTTGIIQRIAEQNDLTLELKLSGRDEFSSMGRHFDAMLQGVRRLIQHTKEAVDQLTQVTAELSANAEQTSAGGRQQLTEADLLATAITEMAATIDEIARNTELATERTQRTDTNAQAGQNQVQDTIRHIESLSGRLQESTRAVQELAHNSEAIGSVLNVIRGIAEQTNLLALNAAIEAARAGEQGRGFAVVAGEVRALAQRTQTATAEIADIITALQQKIQGLVDLIQTCHGEGLDSVTQANQAGALLARISEDMGHILDMNTQIAAAIEEQSQVTNEVNRNVVAIRDVAERTAVASQGNAHASARVAQQSESLARLISRFRC